MDKFEIIQFKDGTKLYFVDNKEVTAASYRNLKQQWKKDPETVDHPTHYADGRKFEPIDVIEDWGLGFCLGNAVKYISRAGRKDDYLTDIKKAVWYLEREIQKREQMIEEERMEKLVKDMRKCRTHD